VDEVDAVARPAEMDSKDSELFSRPVPVPAPVYELPSPGGGGCESELDGEDTQRGSRSVNPVSDSSPLGRDGLAANENEVRRGLPGKF
jgi:hypothetical protein